jgi:hypothetical protein
MIRRFIYIWVGYWLLVLVLPVHSISPSVLEALLLQLSFVGLVVIGYGLGIMQAREVSLPSVCTGGLLSVRILVKVGLFMSMVGLGCLLYDKIYIQGIDYSSGLAVAREQWRILGEEREGRASSMWSVLGYALSCGYYVAAVLAVSQPDRFDGRKRLAVIGTAFLFALCNSVITGGRSNLILIVAVTYAALSARSGLKLGRVFDNRKQRYVLAALSLLAGIYAVYVFYARAKASDEIVFSYVEGFLPYMGLAFDDWYKEAAHLLGAPGHMTVLVVGYLTHSFATTAAILDVDQEDKIIIFSNVAGILYKFGVIGRPDGDWFLAGRFPSVPGALWHQFGPIGYVVFSFALGVSGAWASMWTRARPAGLIPMAAYVLVAATLFLTPFTFAPDFMSFSSVAVAFCILAIVGAGHRYLCSLGFARSVVSMNSRGSVIVGGPR